MRLLLALDSRPSNQAAIGILDPHTASWERFDIKEIAEPFKRRGFRGCTLVDDRLYVLSSAAIYIYRANLKAGETQFELLRTVRRPEWEVGERAAADLHHVHYSRKRGTLLVANSFMDAVDELTLDGDFIAHRYLWDFSPAVAEVAQQRNPTATDLVHINHISEYNGRIYLTLGNWNGTRIGKVICYDTGEVVLENVHFPHDGFVHDGDFYISATGNSEILIYENVGEFNLLGRQPDHVLPVQIRQQPWENSFQWVRGIHVTDEHILCGVTQWRNETIDQPQIPPRLVCYDRRTKQFQGELFLPMIEDFPSPSIFSLIPLPDERELSLDFSLWERQAPQPELASLPLPSIDNSSSKPGTGIWPGTWTPYRDPGIEEQAEERVVGITLPKLDATNRLAAGWSYVQRDLNEVKSLPEEASITVSQQVVFYNGDGYRNTAPNSGELPGQQFLQLRFRGQAAESTKLGCDLYCWLGDDKRPQIQEFGQVQLMEQMGEFDFWAYLNEPARSFRLVFRMYQPHQIELRNLELSLYATLPDQDRLGSAATAHTDAGEASQFAHLGLLPRWKAS